MNRPLPPKASYRFLQEQAKDLLKAHKSGSAQACRSLRLLRRFTTASDREILTAQVALHEAQFALALDYGFKSWADLASHVRSVESELAAEESLVRPDSLSETLDAANEALFFDRPLPQARRNEAALWIAARQGLPGSFMGMFAPTPADITNGLRVFTGEPVRSRASLCHVLGEEACRVLRQIGSGNELAEAAYQRAAAEVARRLAAGDGKPYGTIGSDYRPTSAHTGLYCCVMCSCALWRHLAASGIPAAVSAPQDRLASALSALRHHRDGEGRWKSFPFWYTLLVLTDLQLPEALEEIRYAAPAVARSRKALRRDDTFSQRRRELAERVLSVAEQNPAKGA